MACLSHLKCLRSTCHSALLVAAAHNNAARACHADDPDFGWTVVIYTIEKLRILPSHSPKSKAAKARKLLSHQKAGSPAAVAAAAGVPSDGVPEASVVDATAAMAVAATEPADERSAASEAAVESVNLNAAGRCCNVGWQAACAMHLRLLHDDTAFASPACMPVSGASVSMQDLQLARL